MKVIRIVPTDLKAIEDALVVKKFKGSVVGVDGCAVLRGRAAAKEESGRLRCGSVMRGEIKAVVGVLVGRGVRWMLTGVHR